MGTMYGEDASALIVLPPDFPHDDKRTGASETPVLFALLDGN